MKLVNLIKLENPGKFTRLDPESADKYNEIELTTKPIIRTFIKSEFEESLINDTGFCDDKIPEEEIKTFKTLGEITFTIKIKPTTKRPEYKEVFEDLINFLSFNIRDYDKGILKKGIITIENEPYILIDTVIEQISSQKDIISSGRLGLSKSITYITSREIIAPTSFVFNTENNYKILTGNNALDYVLTDKLYEAASAFSSEFEESIKILSCWSKENKPSETQIELRQIGNFIYPLVSKPTRVIGYGAIINSLIKSYEKKITKKTGELIRVREQFQKNELDGEVINIYNPKIKNEKVYISIDKLIERVHKLKEINTEDTLEQKIKKPPIYIK
ncbi:MAG: hypothetical protein QXG00_02065 [Candidatus Woesearchaeota archaeon]